MIYGLYLYGKSIGIREWKDGCGGIKFYWLNEGIYQILVPNPTQPNRTNTKTNTKFTKYQPNQPIPNTKKVSHLRSPFSNPLFCWKLSTIMPFIHLVYLIIFDPHKWYHFLQFTTQMRIFAFSPIPIFCIYCFVMIFPVILIWINHILIWWKFLSPSLSTVIV